jgi:hypothetical protein
MVHFPFHSLLHTIMSTASIIPQQHQQEQPTLAISVLAEPAPIPLVPEWANHPPLHHRHHRHHKHKRRKEENEGVNRFQAKLDGATATVRRADPLDYSRHDEYLYHPYLRSPPHSKSPPLLSPRTSTLRRIQSKGVEGGALAPPISPKPVLPRNEENNILVKKEHLPSQPQTRQQQQQPSISTPARERILYEVNYKDMIITPEGSTKERETKFYFSFMYPPNFGVPRDLFLLKKSKEQGSSSSSSSSSSAAQSPLYHKGIPFLEVVFNALMLEKQSREIKTLSLVDPQFHHFVIDSYLSLFLPYLKSLLGQKTKEQEDALYKTLCHTSLFSYLKKWDMEKRTVYMLDVSGFDRVTTYMIDNRNGKEEEYWKHEGAVPAPFQPPH